MAVGIGFAAGVIGQYICDIAENIQSGKTGLGILKPKSSFAEYTRAGVLGAVAAIPGLNLAKTMVLGTISQLASDFSNGDVQSVGDVVKSIGIGAVSSLAGVGGTKIMSALKVKQIGEMSRGIQKQYLKNNVYFSSQSQINSNYREFNSLNFSGRMSVIQSNMRVFKSGIYSTTFSTSTNVVISIYRG